MGGRPLFGKLPRPHRGLYRKGATPQWQRKTSVWIPMMGRSLHRGVAYHIHIPRMYTQAPWPKGMKLRVHSSCPSLPLVIWAPAYHAPKPRGAKGRTCLASCLMLQKCFLGPGGMYWAQYRLPHGPACPPLPTLSMCSITTAPHTLEQWKLPVAFFF